MGNDASRQLRTLCEQYLNREIDDQQFTLRIMALIPKLSHNDLLALALLISQDEPGGMQ